MDAPDHTPVKKRPMDPTEHADDFTPEDKIPQAKRYKSLSTPNDRNFVSGIAAILAQGLAPTFGIQLASVLMRVVFLEHPRNIGLLVFDALERMSQEDVDRLIDTDATEEPEHVLDTVDRIIASVLG